MKTLLLFALLFALYIYIYNASDKTKILFAKIGIAIVGLVLLVINSLWEIVLIIAAMTVLSKIGL